MSKKPMIKSYKVVKHCLGHAPGQVVRLQPRQAVSLVAGGLLIESKATKPRRARKSEPLKQEIEND